MDLENNTDEATMMKLRIVYTDGMSETKDIGLTANTAKMIEVLGRSGEGKKIASVEIRFENTKTVDGIKVPVDTRRVSVKGIRVR
jgi:ABC-type transport system involved in cytochrome bd biosynthesis fused ATPase/permease subunit